MNKSQELERKTFLGTPVSHDWLGLENNIRVLKQPKWSFISYEEIYQFDICDCVSVEKLKEKITYFYKLRNAKEFIIKGNEISLAKGTLWGSFFSISETKTKHNLMIKIIDNVNRLTINCKYDIFDPYPDYHTNPRECQVEVLELQNYLLGMESTTINQQFCNNYNIFFVVNLVFSILTVFLLPIMIFNVGISMYVLIWFLLFISLWLLFFSWSNPKLKHLFNRYK